MATACERGNLQNVAQSLPKPFNVVLLAVHLQNLQLVYCFPVFVTTNSSFNRERSMEIDGQLGCVTVCDRRVALCSHRGSSKGTRFQLGCCSNLCWLTLSHHSISIVLHLFYVNSSL